MRSGTTMMKASKTTLLMLATLGVACGGSEADLASESRSAVVAADVDCAECTDPTATGDEKRGGATSVATSSSAAAKDAQGRAREAACQASEGTATAPPCLTGEADCEPVSTKTTCAYSDEACPVVSTFSASPSQWVAACLQSDEPDAWKQANCNRRSGPAGKPHFALCTATAVATVETDCEKASRDGGVGAIDSLFHVTTHREGSR